MKLTKDTKLYVLPDGKFIRLSDIWRNEREQILDDYEKARKWEELQIGSRKQVESLTPRERRVETIQNQKLRELLEKKIRNLPGQIECAISPSWKQDYELLLIEFKSLSEDSKK